jgi:poly(3-hydroxybutyrate) depolymerase
MTARAVIALALAIGGVAMLITDAIAGEVPEVPGASATEVLITSTLDGTEQPSVVVVPDGYDPDTPTPLLLGMHTWSSNYLQMVASYGALAVRHNWLLILPNFRGPNKAHNPEPLQAGGSLYMQRDILDAYDWMVANYNVDLDRVYATGGSGGGYATLLIVGKYPHLFAAAAAWCPVSDLKDWWSVQNGYAKDVVAVTGGEPGDSPEVDFEYLRRSPRTFMSNLAHVPVMLAHGDRDPTIPVQQSWDMFARLRELPAHKGYFYVFSGGHTSKAAYGLDWCADFVRPAAPPTDLRLVTDESKSYYWADLRVADGTRLATCDLRLADDVLTIISDNIAGVELTLEELPIPDEGGMSLAVRSAEELTVVLMGLPASASVKCSGGWARVVTSEAVGALTLRIEASPEARSFRIAY